MTLLGNDTTRPEAGIEDGSTSGPRKAALFNPSAQQATKTRHCRKWKATIDSSTTTMAELFRYLLELPWHAQMPERSKGLCSGRNVFALVGSNPTLRISFFN